MSFIQENAFENVVWKMSAILSRPQCVDQVRTAADCNIHSLVQVCRILQVVSDGEPTFFLLHMASFPNEISCYLYHRFYE